MIPKITVGNTGILVSRAGLGTVKFGRNQQVKYPQEFTLPSDETIQELLSYAKDLGINLLDTAPAYGLSEERLGNLLQKSRPDWILCSKVGEEFNNGQSSFDFSPKAVQKSIERSLKRLKTDYLDIVLVHSNGEDTKIIEEDGIFSTLAELKKSGKVRTFGMSTKTVAGGRLAVDYSDIVMVTYNPLFKEDQTVIDYAYQKNKGVFIKKALASGHLEKISVSDPVGTIMRFIFKAQGISSVILGTLSKKHLQFNVDCIIEALFINS